MGLVVTAISPGADTGGIEQALRAAALPLDSLTVFAAGEGLDDRADSGIRFVYTGADTARTILGRGSEITSFGGTEVPGLEVSGGAEYFPEESISMQLSELEIPDGEVDNYVDAIESGHAVVAYLASQDNLTKVEEAFRSSGLRNVRTF